MRPEKFILLFQQQPDKAIYYLYRKSKPIRRWITSRGGSREEADDCLQEALMRFYQQIRSGKLSLSTPPEGYLMGIVKNLWLSEVRDRSKRMSLVQEMNQESIQPIEEDLDSIPSQGIELPLILDQLGKKCSRLLKLFYFQKQSMVYIARHLHFRNDKVAKAMKYKCLQKARKLFTQQDPGV